MDETRDDPTPAGDEPASLDRRRIARTALGVGIAAALVAAALGVGSDRRDSSPEESPEAGAASTIDVSLFPRGALAGEPAPDISVVLFDGSTFVLSDHLVSDGRPLVLNLWASWCTPCRREIPDFSRVAEANPAVAFIGVAVEDARGPAQAFASEVGASFPLGIDEDLTVKNGYPFIGLPVTYLIDAAGVVTRQFQGRLDSPALQALIDHDFGV